MRGATCRMHGASHERAGYSGFTSSHACTPSLRHRSPVLQLHDYSSLRTHNAFHASSTAHGSVVAKRPRSHIQLCAASQANSGSSGSSSANGQAPAAMPPAVTVRVATDSAALRASAYLRAAAFFVYPPGRSGEGRTATTVTCSRVADVLPVYCCNVVGWKHACSSLAACRWCHQSVR